MTTQEMIDELQAALGNRQDIADARYVQWLNWAQYDLCGFHRKRAFPSLRFRALEGKFIMNIPVVTGTSQGTAEDNEIVLAASVDEDDDYFVDCVISLTDYDGDEPEGLTGQTRMIVGYDGASGTVTVDEDWDVNPDSDTTYEIYRREFDIETFTSLDPRVNLWAIERFETIRGTEVKKVDWEELINLDGTDALADTPTRFARRGNTILFDNWITNALSLRAWYYQYPPMLDDGSPDVESVLPEAWHEVMVLGAIWRGHERLMEPERAEEAFNIYQNEATNRLNQYQIEEEHIERGLKARSYYANL